MVFKMFIVQIVFVVCFNNYPSNRNCSAIQRLQICCEYLISAKSCSCFMCCRLSAPPSFFPHDMKVRSRSSEETAGVTKILKEQQWYKSPKVVSKLSQSYESEVEVFRRVSKLSQSSTKVVSDMKVRSISFEETAGII